MIFRMESRPQDKSRGFFCVVGGGKMGLSHLALITPYVGKDNVVLVERKLTVRCVFKLMGYQTFSDLDAVQNKLGAPRGVIIATPTSTHACLVEWALRNRIPCFVEKPLTLDAESSACLLRLARETGVFAQTGFVMRYVHGFQRLRDLVEDGRLGNLLSYSASMRGNVMVKAPEPENWQGDFKRGGGALNEYGPHLIDLCKFVFGDVTEVCYVDHGSIHCKHADDWITFDFNHKRGVNGRLQINWCDTSKRKSVIEIKAEFDGGVVRVDNSAFGVDFSDACSLDIDARAKLREPNIPPTVGFFLRGEEFSLELEDFLGHCLEQPLFSQGAVKNVVTPTLHDGHVVDQIIGDIAIKAGLK